MANTIIQIKRSTTTSVPPDGSLSSAEPAYSYLSDKLFIGTSDGSGTIAIGGKHYIDQQNVIFDLANAAFNYANTISSDADEKANIATITANVAYDAANAAFLNSNVSFDVANAAILTANLAFDSANAGQLTANVAFDKANAANLLAYETGIGANAYTDAATVAANNYANGTFVKLTAPDQTITGNLSITGSLTVAGNAYVIDTETLRISDPLIYLAGNNYISDSVDIGFVANYNDGSANLHTGFFRDHLNKEYYIFQGYTEEPDPNHIDTTANGFTLAVLNADLRTSNLVLGGVNAISWLDSVYYAANSAFLNSNVNFDATNAAFLAANSAFLNSNVAFDATNVSFNTANAAYIHANASMLTANAAYDQANAASAQAANADFLTSGTVNTARISGSYTGITGVGTLTVGTWNADTITVPYGGTGKTSFTQNGVLFGNTSGDLKVTAAGTEGQVLQATSTGVPQFGMLDGGNF